MNKKHLLIAMLAASCHVATAALVTVTFDGLDLPSAGYQTDWGGEIEIGGVVFTNNYDAEEDTWSGFAISNLTGGSSGPNQQFSAITITGGGLGGSGNYAIGRFDGSPGILSTVIDFDEVINEHPGSLKNLGAYFTNTALVYEFLISDDGFVSKPVGGDGIPDFYKLVIMGFDSPDVQNAEMTGTVEFLLATNDSIISDWTFVDMTDLDVDRVRAIRIDVESSLSVPDMPLYFAMDNFQLVPEPSSLLMALGGFGLLLRRRR